MKDDLLSEMSALKDLAKSMGILSPSVKRDETERERVTKGHRHTEDEAKKLITKIVHDLKGKEHASLVKGGENGKIIRVQVDFGDSPYVLKAFLTPDSGHLALTLWNQHETELLDPIASGYVREYLHLLSSAKERLKKYTG